MTIAYVGGYTEPDRGGRGKGIYVFEMNDATGVWRELQVLEGVPNPSFLALSADRRFLYSVNGGSASGASAFAVDGAGKLTFLNRESVGAGNPAHIAIAPGGRHAITANYGAGSVSVLPIGADGRLSAATEVRKHEGPTGPNAARQDGPHPHQSTVDPSGKFVLVNDLGLDRTFVYRFDGAAGKLVPHDPSFGPARPGAGPRHLAFSPDAKQVYVINELDSTIGVNWWDGEKGTLAQQHSVSTLPPDFAGTSATAQIVVHPSGRYVYGSNRGHDSIAIFSVNQVTRRLTAIGHEPTQGKTPRNFNVDPAGKFLYAANQDGGTVVTFRIEAEGGQLVPTGQVIDAGSPSCVIFRA